MIDLEKIKKYCKSYDWNCRKEDKYCAFINSDDYSCMLQAKPYELNTKKIEKIYNELFGEIK